MLEHLFDTIESRRGDLVDLRRDLHAHPELAFQEKRTAGIVEARLRAAGLEVRGGLAQTGVVGVLRGSRPGRTVLVRADIDALPIQETSEAPYKSQIPGRMHACAHDGHTAIALVLAEIMAERRGALAGTLTFAFQPAEEITSGALPMIEAGAMGDPPADAAIGLHIWNDLPVGTVAASPGPVFGAVDEIAISIEGRGGHGAVPHLATDPIVAAAQAIVALQTVVSRETAPLETAVVTVAMIHAGTAFNIIPDRVEMRGTVRSFADDVRERTLRRVEEIAAGVAGAMRCKATLTTRFGTPPVVNDEAVTAVVREVAARVVSAERVVSQTPTTGGDDMAYFLQRAPGCYFAVGSCNRDRGLDAAHHNPRFDFDEEALVIGAKVLGGAALRLTQ